MDNELTMKQQIAENARQIGKRLKAMPKCAECGCPRIKHGVYCNQSCGSAFCFCEAYRLPATAKASENQEKK